jgi:hypothetical protein
MGKVLDFMWFFYSGNKYCVKYNLLYTSGRNNRPLPERYLMDKRKARQAAEKIAAGLTAAFLGYSTVAP